jgi:hypothetical protein
MGKFKIKGLDHTRMYSHKRQPSFGELFLARLQELEEEAKLCGLNMTVICKEAGISRASPDRWRRELPKTILLMETMEEIVAKRQSDLRLGTKESHSKS